MDPGGLRLGLQFTCSPFWFAVQGLRGSEYHGHLAWHLARDRSFPFPCIGAQVHLGKSAATKSPNLPQDVIAGIDGRQPEPGGRNAVAQDEAEGGILG